MVDHMQVEESADEGYKMTRTFVNRLRRKKFSLQGVKSMTTRIMKRSLNRSSGKY